ncbi:YdcF family protein, partial [Pseudophaeobacter sp.]|uniref:YdcF family protein n=1 Tax=Pseudophaeobacter sp. TaxID=1971739 RepID=UPI0032991F9E
MTVAVVLGAAVHPGGRASPTLRRRTLRAVDLLKTGQVSHVICSGGLGQNPPSEAEVMRQICAAEGVADDCILLEDQSHTTIENLANSRAILAALGNPDVVIVTDHYHKWRALLVARHLALQARASCPKQ